ncbi:MAG: sel1 repeat family protein, partial [Desulfovibrio sp.]|nr:sel1 repeat family protein [Desulfovibrio sp.]
EGSASAIAELKSMAKDNKTSAALFGQTLDKTDRDKMREALKKAGAKSRREDDLHICDVYEAANLVPGAGDMAVCYGPDKRLAFLKIDYMANDKNRADAIVDMVEKRFGSPTAGEGEDAKLWNLGPVIVATQYAPTYRQMSLMYMVPEVYHLTQKN